MSEEKIVQDIAELMEIPEDYYYISKPKLMISKEIKKGLEKENLSIRQLGKRINLKHPQITRVTQVKNYNIDTLLRILNGLDLEIEIKPRSKVNKSKENLTIDNDLYENIKIKDSIK